jgi:SNF2 family DNA or RNA helicase
MPIHHFLSRKRWFVSTWIPEGGFVSMEESTKAAISLAERQYMFFKKGAETGVSVSQDRSLTVYERALKPFQESNIRSLMSVPAGANFSVPGAGKTTTTLALWNELRIHGDIRALLVVCPRSAFESWLTEPQKLFVNPPKVMIFDDGVVDPSAQVLIVNFERLENEGRLDVILQWMRQRSTHLVIDEAHRVKGGANSVRWRRCKSLSLEAKRVDLLTGTPMPQGYDDLRNLLALSWPYVPRSYLTDNRLSDLGRAGLFVRTTKAELNLPDLSLHSHLLPMGDYQQAIYQALRKKYEGVFHLSEKQRSYFGAKGRAVMTLLATASNPGLLMGIHQQDAYMGLEWPPNDVSIDQSLLDIVGRYASYEIPPKYKWVVNYVHEASLGGRKVIVWSNFIGNILALKRLLEPYNPAVVFGATTLDERASEIDRFRSASDCNVLITNPQTLGEGVSLHEECHEAIYLDRSFNAGHYLQSIDRIHRLGLPKDQVTTIHFLQSQATIDEQVAVRIEQKVQTMSEVLNDHDLVRFSLPEEDLTGPIELLGMDSADFDVILRHLAAI